MSFEGFAVRRVLRNLEPFGAVTEGCAREKHQTRLWLGKLCRGWNLKPKELFSWLGGTALRILPSKLPAAMSDFKLHRLGQLMEPEPGNPMEAGGVTNPAAVRGSDGHLYLFPRLVAEGNYSR